MDTPELGKLLPGDERRRDAIHVAIAPATALTRLKPGEHVGIASFKDGEAQVDNLAGAVVGIVDPFLTDDLQAGDRFWLLLYPKSITTLRHYWSHPAFSLQAQSKSG